MVPVLKEELPSINIVLNLLGFSALINDEDKTTLNIYDKFGNFHENVPTHFFIEFKFKDKNKDVLEYTIDRNKHTVIYGDTTIELMQHPIGRNCTSIRIIKYYEDDNTTKKFFISSDSITVSLDSDIFSRYVSYTNRLENYSLFMQEKDPINGNHDLVVGTFGINSNSGILKQKNYTKLLKSIKPLVAAKSIITHPRNKELIEYIINVFDKDFPGIKDFVENKFVFYNSIMMEDYIDHKLITPLIEETINHNCDIEQILKEKKKV